MESLMIWGVALLLIGIIFIPYVLKFHKQQKRDHERKQEAVALGADKPIAQYPQIDEMQCIGCGTCVSACPEGDVLGIVFGKATVINGLKCVGHGKCAEACPVSGITVGLGDIKMRDDIPFMTDHQETNIPGLYVAGELGGLALIKNAISQGQRVMERIVETTKATLDENIYDVIIVGAGPTGISAGLTGLQHQLNCLILDQQGFGGTILQYPRKKLVMTKPIEIPLYGWLTKTEYEKEELLAIWQDIQEKYDLRFIIGEKLMDVILENNLFKVVTQNQSYYCQRVVLALGRRGTPRKLLVPGEKQSKVMYKLIDAESYTGNYILVVGGGDSAVEAAIGLAHQSGNTVTLSYRKNKLFRIKKKNETRLQDIVESGGIQTIFDSNVKKIKDKSIVLATKEGDVELPNDFVFIFAGGEPPFKLLKQIGIQFGGEREDKTETLEIEPQRDLASL